MLVGGINSTSAAHQQRTQNPSLLLCPYKHGTIQLDTASTPLWCCCWDRGVIVHLNSFSDNLRRRMSFRKEQHHRHVILPGNSIPYPPYPLSLVPLFCVSSLTFPHFCGRQSGWLHFFQDLRAQSVTYPATYCMADHITRTLGSDK